MVTLSAFSASPRLCVRHPTDTFRFILIGHKPTKKKCLANTPCPFNKQCILVCKTILPVKHFVIRPSSEQYAHNNLLYQENGGIIT